MIDIHSHILPKLDDGAKDLDTTIEMLKIAAMEGTKKIIATPHYYRGYYENHYNDIVAEVNNLNKIAMENKIDIEILPGQEVFLDKHILGDHKSEKIKGLNDTKYLLVELPFDKLPDYAMDTIYELRLMGLTPILAHPERYKYIIDKISNINQFAKEGCLFQINTGSITGVFGKSVEKTAESLLKNGMGNFVASDCHTTNKRCPGLKKSYDIVRKMDKKIVNKMKENVENVIENEEICNNYQLFEEKKSIFSFFSR